MEWGAACWFRHRYNTTEKKRPGLILLQAFDDHDTLSYPWLVHLHYTHSRFPPPTGTPPDTCLLFSQRSPKQGSRAQSGRKPGGLPADDRLELRYTHLRRQQAKNERRRAGHDLAPTPGVRTPALTLRGQVSLHVCLSIQQLQQLCTRVSHKPAMSPTPDTKTNNITAPARHAPLRRRRPRHPPHPPGPPHPPPPPPHHRPRPPLPPPARTS